MINFYGSEENSAILRHDNHTPGTASFGLRTFTAPTNYMLIRNGDSTNNILVSFDGTNGFTLYPRESAQFFLSRQKNYYTKASGGSPAAEVIYGSDQ